MQIGSLALLGLVLIVSWANRFTFPKRETAAAVVIISGAIFIVIGRIKKLWCQKRMGNQVHYH